MARQTKAQGQKPAPEVAQSYFVDESAKDYRYADYVQVMSNPHGMVLYFGKWHPEERKFGLFDGIVLPFSVADALCNIVQKQLKDLAESINSAEKELKEGGGK